MFAHVSGWDSDFTSHASLKAVPERVFVQLARFGRIDAGRQPVHRGQERLREKSTTDFQSVAGGSFRAYYRFESYGSWNCFIARITAARFFQSSLATDATSMKHG